MCYEYYEQLKTKKPQTVTVAKKEEVKTKQERKPAKEKKVPVVAPFVFKQQPF